MAEITSTLTLYYSTGLHKEKNFIIESFSSYLEQFSYSQVLRFQYIKNQLNLTIKVDLSQDNLDTKASADIDYLSIKNSNETRTYYYFVVNKTWKGQNTVEMILTLDTLNTFTFNSDYTLSEKTLVLREHKDRITTLSNKSPELLDLTDDEKSYLEGVFDGNVVSEDWTIFIDFGAMRRKTGSEDPPIFRFNTYFDDDYQTTSSVSLVVYNQDGTIAYSFPTISVLSLLADGNLSINSGHTTTTIYSGAGYIFALTFDSGADSPYFQLETNSTYTNQTSEWFILYGFNQFFNGFFYPLGRNIDKYPENINPILYKKSETYLYDADGEDNWYLIYANENSPISQSDDTSEKYVNPVKILFAKDTPYKVSSRTAVRRSIVADNIPKINNMYEILGVVGYSGVEAGAYIEINGTQYSIDGTLGGANYNYMKAFKVNNSDQYFTHVVLYKLNSDGKTIDSSTVLNNVGEIIFYGVANGYIATGFGSYSLTDVNDYLSFTNRTQFFYIGSNSEASSYTSSDYSQLDTTLSQLIKVIALPYAPLSFLDGLSEISGLPDQLSWNNTFNYLQLVNNKRINFDYEKDFGTNSPFTDLYFDYHISGYSKKSRIDGLESKMYHSEFTQNQFVYDSYVFNFQLELINTTSFFAQDNYRNFVVEYMVSKKLSSKFVFKFNQYVCDGYELENYNNVLIIDRNNEVPLFTNAYINYMRTGFQFDQSNKQNAQTARWSGVALSTISAIASFASVAGTGPAGIVAGVSFTTSTIAQLVSTISTVNQQENAMSQKQLQLARQSESVQGSDDVELFKMYGQNKAKLVKYQPSDVMKNLILDLFYYFGYNTKEYKIPQINTRIYFNYLQCELVLNETNNIPGPIIDDIKLSFKEGATFFHKYDNDWDIEQQYENFETSLI